jgi:hypothetical protein
MTDVTSIFLLILNYQIWASFLADSHAGSIAKHTA